MQCQRSQVGDLFLKWRSEVAVLKVGGLLEKSRNLLTLRVNTVVGLGLEPRGKVKGLRIWLSHSLSGRGKS